MRAAVDAPVERMDIFPAWNHHPQALPTTLEAGSKKSGLHVILQAGFPPVIYSLVQQLNEV